MTPQWVTLHPTARHCAAPRFCGSTANLRTKVLDFRGFDSSRNLISRGGIIMSIGNSQEVLSQLILVGRILVRRWGVLCCKTRCSATALQVYCAASPHQLGGTTCLTLLV